MSPSLKEEVDSCRASVKDQGDVVNNMKAVGAPQVDLDLAIKELKARKRILEQKELQLDPPEVFNRGKLEDLLKRRFFYTPAFEIYGGVAGLYDFGPLGCAMETQIVNLWRKHFILEEQLLEVRCTQLTPANVLKVSGHVDRFTDVMVRDVKTADCYRADHLLEGHLEKLLMNKKLNSDKQNEYKQVLSQLDNYKRDKLWELLQKYEVLAPGTGNKLCDPQDFNLMFGTSIGPGGMLAGFMRPETAQGIFLNFKRLLEYNNGRLPFGGAQIGCGFRNEISPRAGLLRVREFLMAEIEYFVDPEKKEIPKFSLVAETVCSILSKENQMCGAPAQEMSLKSAIEQGIIANTAVAYFLARIHSFMLGIGVDAKKMRFRHHMANEMAHYACDCWDCELKTSYGWIECVGCADRACFDLTQHSNATGENLVAMVDLPQPVIENIVEVVLEKAVVGKCFLKQAHLVHKYVKALNEQAVERMEKDIQENGIHKISSGDEVHGSNIEAKMIKEVRRYNKEVYVREVFPHVIEPSFGIGRIMYAVLEHNFRIREGDEKRTWLALPCAIAPVKCSILPLSKNEAFHSLVSQISSQLTEMDISHRVDDSSGSIGRRYARTDEIAIPFGITVDFDTLNKSPQTVTLRERDSTSQIRVDIGAVCQVVNDLVRCRKMWWPDVVAHYGLFEGQETITVNMETLSVA